MKVKYVGFDGEIDFVDSDVTIGKVYDVVRVSSDDYYPVRFIDDIGEEQYFSWSVLEIVEEG